ncbi:translation initiation factor IF-2 N-terminal domain-containing protein, partial [Nocardioides sp.]|uniref:translation initiation factor IF-2 N-terminal domain-containing protein n=1 Tax=Nocardioides sp. TaxID=35761 RepID=UPI0025D09418
MAKTRVSELAKKYGIPSKEALEKLGAIGEFAKTASSSIELPAVKKFEDTYGAELLGRMKSADAPAPSSDEKPAPAKKAAAPQAPEAEAPAAQAPAAPAPAAPAPAAPAPAAPAEAPAAK